MPALEVSRAIQSSSGTRATMARAAGTERSHSRKRNRKPCIRLWRRLRKMTRTLFTVKLEGMTRADARVTVCSAGFKTEHADEYSAAKKIGDVDARELWHWLEKKQGLVFVIKRG